MTGTTTFGGAPPAVHPIPNRAARRRAASAIPPITIGGHTPQLGLDLQGGVSVVLQPKQGDSPNNPQVAGIGSLFEHN